MYRKTSSLYPSYSELNSKINENYSIARAYYEQRQKIFQKTMLNGMNEAVDNFKETVNKTVNEFFKYVIGNVHAALQGEEIKYTGSDKGAQTYEAYVSDILKLAHHHWTVNRHAGVALENFLVENMMSNSSLAKIMDLPKKIVNNLMQSTGEIENISAVTKYKAEVRSDIAMSQHNIDKDAQLELTGLVELEDFEKQLSNPELVYSELIKAFENNGNPDMTIFGFQVKTYKDSNDKRWMNSAAIAERLKTLTDVFNNTMTWSSNYAAIYPTYYISKVLINVLNPVNVALISQGGLEWMTDFLDKYRLYMEVTYHKPRSPKKSPDYRGGGLEIYPELYGNTIMMRYIKGSQGLHATGNMHYTKQYNVDRIKVFSIKPI